MDFIMASFAYKYLLNMYVSVCTYVLRFDEIEIWTYPVHFCMYIRSAFR